MKPVMTDQILLSGMAFNSHVGVFPEEKQNGQTFIIDVVLHCERLPATDTDILAQTADYGKAYTLIKKTVEQARYNLIERLAGAVADALLQSFRIVVAVDVTVRKPQAPVDGLFDFMGVRIYRERAR